MISIRLTGIAKKFGNQVVFTGVNAMIGQGSRFGIAGRNGSGKTTLLGIIAGLITPDGGQIAWESEGKPVDRETLYSRISIAAPYMELPWELCLASLLRFHTGLRPFRNAMNAKTFSSLTGFDLTDKKPLSAFSSGMKQKLRLALALYTNSDLILLDEPLSNTDETNAQWFRDQIETLDPIATLIICSNNPDSELTTCTQILRLDDYKKP